MPTRFSLLFRHAMAMLLILSGMPARGAAGAAPMRPGQWETTVQVNMPGMPVQAQQHTLSECVTAEQARDPQRAMAKMNQPGEGGQTCQMTHYDLSGNTAHWAVDCTGPNPAHGEGEMIFDSDTAYHGTMHMSMAGPQGEMTMTQNLRGRRTGECKR